MNAARLLALELYRRNCVSLGRAAELCGMAIESFMVFAGPARSADALQHFGSGRRPADP
jgi:hypothetical protein